MKVLIVRHAIAADREAGGYESDDERPLTPKGARRMQQAALGLVRALPPPAAIYTSPLVRAAETARILSGAWGVPAKAETIELLAPGHPPADVGRWLKTLPAGDTVALVGHEPGCSALLSFLLGAPGLGVDFKKGGAALVELSSDRGQPKGTLLWFATPRLLRLAAG